MSGASGCQPAAWARVRQERWIRPSQRRSSRSSTSRQVEAGAAAGVGCRSMEASSESASRFVESGGSWSDPRADFAAFRASRAARSARASRAAARPSAVPSLSASGAGDLGGQMNLASRGPASTETGPVGFGSLGDSSLGLDSISAEGRPPLKGALTRGESRSRCAAAEVGESESPTSALYLNLWRNSIEPRASKHGGALGLLTLQADAVKSNARGARPHGRATDRGEPAACGRGPVSHRETQALPRPARGW